jgi:hypothetical protein
MPRIVTVISLIAGLVLANRYTPGVVQAVLVLVAIYLVVTHADQVGRVFVNASAGLARDYGATPRR